MFGRDAWLGAACGGCPTRESPSEGASELGRPFSPPIGTATSLVPPADASAGNRGFEGSSSMGGGALLDTGREHSRDRIDRR